jgi:CheY-like chemotaxis protein
MQKKQARILVVEDESLVALDIRNTLERLGYAVPATVFSGEDAVKKAEELQPDLVLMDIMLAGDMDGIEAADIIHTRCDIPVIYLTAYADDETLARAKITDPFGYLLKPFEARELHVAIEIALYKHAMEQQLSAALENEREFKLRAAHFFFNPLAIARGNLELAREEGGAHEYIDRALEAISRIETVVKNVTEQGKIFEKNEECLSPKHGRQRDRRR